MRLNLIGPFQVNAPFGTEIAFSKGLKRLGHEVVEVDPNIDEGLDDMDQTADATVVFKSCVGRERYLKRLKGPVVTYQPDDARFPHIREMMLMMRQYSDLFLSFDHYGAGIARQMQYRDAETLLLTADDELYCEGPAVRDIDVSFIGSLGDPVAHASRRRMCEVVQREAEKRNWKVAFGTTQDIPQILSVYRRSKVVLNHATDVGQGFGLGFGLQCRHFEVGMTRTCLLSNMHAGLPFPLTFPEFFDEGSLILQLEWLLGDDEAREHHAGWLFDQIRGGHMPQHRAQQMVDFIQRNA
jgi:hypothetical protein